MGKITSVEEYIEVNSHFSKEISLLRNIINSTELEETIKWSMPTYCLNGKNVLGLGAFKHHFCIWFHQGVFLKDEHHLLYNTQEEKTKAMRQMRFKSEDTINKAAVLTYVKEAIENQRLGRALMPQRKAKPLIIVKELKAVLNANTELKKMFKTLSISKQREYNDYIKDAKREETKLRRLDKIVPQITNGKALHDKYKDC